MPTPTPAPAPTRSAIYKMDPAYFEMHINEIRASPQVTLIDTGSEINLMSARFAEKAGIFCSFPKHPTPVQQALGGKGVVAKEVRGEVICVLNAGSP